MKESNRGKMREILIGTWSWGSGMGGASMVFGKKQDPEVLKQSFEEAVNRGFLNWDTAAVYGMGTCETLLGTFIKGRDDIFISTKFPPTKRYKQGALTKSFRDSMLRLGRSYADLFWIHFPYNLELNLQELIPLMKEGGVKSIGISNVSLEHIHIAEKVLEKEGLKVGAVQNHFSLLRNDQQPIIDYCNENGIRYYAYMVLEQGALSGKYSAKNPFPFFSLRNYAFPKRKFRKIECLLSVMKGIAGKYDIDPSQVPILWSISKGAIPIVGITKPSHAVKLSEALSVTLTEEDISLIEKAASETGLRQQGIWEPQ
ncbi:MAG TPA: aldo/keto reductase [Bacillota bacterium]|nr:aldo/keto reductase [Bacillota bacterium]